MVTGFLKGNAGNQMFIIATIIGYAMDNDLDYHILNHTINDKIWKPQFNHLENEKFKPSLNSINVNEQEFSYNQLPFKEEWRDKVIILGSASPFNGFFQSYKYFDKYKSEIIKAFRFSVCKKFEHVFEKSVIAISIRRGDFETNPNFVLLPKQYYLNSLFIYFDNVKDYNILVFSDDIEYCRKMFSGLSYPTVYFADVSPKEQLYLAQQCHHFIISNSSFSWWLAYVGEKENSKVVRPVHHFSGAAKLKNNLKDYYPEHWIAHNHKQVLA